MTYSTLWKGEHWLESNGNVPRVAFNVGTQKMEMLPDAMLGSAGELGQISPQYALSTYLSSIEQVPQAQVKFSPLNQTNTFGLFNFGREASDQLDLENLSCYDVLIRRKSPHPLGVAGRCGADLEYVPISALSGGGLHIGDANSPSHRLSSIYLSSDGQYQLYNFDKDGIPYPYEGYVSDFEVVVREKYTSQHNSSQINYLPLSSFNLPGDTNIADYSRRKSIELLDNAGTKYYELYDFHDLGNAITSFGSPNGFDVVVRDYSFPGELPHISYVSLSALNTAISGDTNVFEGATHQSSIETILSGG